MSASAGKKSQRRTHSRDRNRRRRWLHAVAEVLQHKRAFVSGRQKRLVNRSVMMTAQALARRSDDLCSTVYGYQKDWEDENGNIHLGFATEAGCSVRQFQRDVEELVAAGLIVVVRCAIEQMPDGRWARAKTNRYKFKVPRASTSHLKRKKPLFSQGDKEGVYNQQPTVVSETFGLGRNEIYEDPIPIHELKNVDRWSIRNSISWIAKKCVSA